MMTRIAAYRVVEDIRTDSLGVLPPWTAGYSGPDREEGKAYGVVDARGFFVNPAPFCCKVDAQRFARAHRDDDRRVRKARAEGRYNPFLGR